jgi:cytidylate kinase
MIEVDSVGIPVLTIDGPSGAGKGTVSRLLAKSLDWHYLDSGAIYRALAVAAQDSGVLASQADDLVSLAASMRLEFLSQDVYRVLLNGQDISERILTEQCGNLASQIAALAPVRQALLHKQQSFCQAPGLVADGRDMGTVVFPAAKYKIFLTASAEERAQRRYKQLKEKGIDVSLVGLTQDIEERDRRDRERAEAPLRPADEAVIIDSSALSIQQVVERCLSIVNG